MLKFLLLLSIISICVGEKLPTAFSGVVNADNVIAKKGRENTVPLSPVSSGGCFNQHECCHTLRTLGQCVHHREDLKKWCPAACGYCDPEYNPQIECSDRHPECRKLAANGKCTQFAFFMNENCRESCNKCKKTRPEICTGSRRDCSKAPTQAIRMYCEQLQRWDEGARKSTNLGAEVALPPGSHSIADLGN